MISYDSPYEIILHSPDVALFVRNPCREIFVFYETFPSQPVISALIFHFTQLSCKSVMYSDDFLPQFKFSSPAHEAPLVSLKFC